MATLKIADNLNLPLDAVTQTFGVLAKRGVGKTYTAAVFVEELLKAGRQVVVVDPIGVWFGLRSSADGKHAGLPIIVMGGDHGDVPLEVTAGSTIAEFITEQKASVVLDLSRFRKGEQVRFMTDFAETLYHRNRDPLMLVVDEADAYAPQRPQKGEERLLGAMEDLVRRGRARGLGVMLVTQRAAVLNKNVLTQVEVLVVLRTIAPQDREAISDRARPPAARRGVSDRRGGGEMNVRRFLVSGPDTNLQRFHLAVCFVFNAIERRGQTVAYTAFQENAERALSIAAKADVSLQEIHDAGETERYETLHEGTHGLVWTRAAGATK